ncbi:MULTISPECIES: histidine kinase [Streptomyces]|uniref:histidine kinase n=1 Tax=Streptomyces lycii TaxID=2654337 RepID=A0ABQ7FG56_9ACTN|nr:MULTISPECIES: histidine kinase [Streptomyces]KAF4407538.1 histidine kinase [Streptomyces lycii]PGH51017.1 histidine kinase [Streptomyces sp. Ru87]
MTPTSGSGGRYAVTRRVRAWARLLFGRRARLRWVHLVLGGALLMPYFLLAGVVVAPFSGEDNVLTSLGHQLLAFAAALPLVAVSGLFPLARVLETAAARALCGVPGSALDGGASESWAARRRTAAFCTLHLGLGGVVSGMTLAVPPMAALLLAFPLVPELREERLGLGAFGPLTAPLAGAGMLLALAAVVAAAGALQARLLPALLGPTPEDRLAAAERRAAGLAARNRLARELHDSVGHALSAVALQASAARRVLDRDPAFVREALAAIEETTRETVGELDAVLGLLRKDGTPGDGEGDGGGTGGDRGGTGGDGESGDEEGGTGRDGAGAVRGPGRTLRELDGLLARTRAAGVPLRYEPSGDPGGIPEVVSREAYRIVQEGLSNALRHAGQVPVLLRIAVDEDELEICMENPLPSGGTGRAGGGRGLRGITERAALLHGRSEAGARDGVWRLSVRLPLRRAGVRAHGGGR